MLVYFPVELKILFLSEDHQVVFLGALHLLLVGEQLGGDKRFYRVVIGFLGLFFDLLVKVPKPILDGILILMVVVNLEQGTQVLVFLLQLID